MYKLGSVRVGGLNPVRIMGILNTSPESFFKGSIKCTRQTIRDAVKQMEQEGADIIDVGGISTAPYLKTRVSERIESQRIIKAIQIIQNASNLPISIDTCRASVAKNAFDLGVDILNDISGLKYDPQMAEIVSSFRPSLVLCAFSSSTVTGKAVDKTRALLKASIFLAKRSGIKSSNIVLDPSIGFFRKSANGTFFTKIDSDWFLRDLTIIKNLKKLKQNHPLLVSVSNKSFIGKLLDIKDPACRVAGSTAIEAICVLNGADLIRTHNVRQTREAVCVADQVLRLHKGL